MKCELCDGNVVQGKCTQCGLDYTRRERHYRLNSNCETYDSKADKSKLDYLKTLATKADQDADRIKHRQGKTKPGTTGDFSQELRKFVEPRKQQGTKLRKPFLILVIIYVLIMLAVGLFEQFQGIKEEQQMEELLDENLMEDDF